MTDRAAVEDWVRRYVTAWDSNDPDDIRSLFTTDAEYRWNPWDEPVRGHDAIVDAWLDHADQPGDCTFAWEIAAVDGDTAVVRGRTDCVTGEAAGHRYANLWLVRMAADGTAGSFTEWWMEPRG